MLKIKYLNSSFFIAMGFVFLFCACKKEYLKTPYTHIETFSVMDDKGNTVLGSVDSDTIIVYWAPFQTIPEMVTPQIALAPGASITPATGTKVDFKTGTAFTVTAQDGSIQKYYLKVVINEPAPDFETNGTTFVLGDVVGLTGQYFIPDTSKTKFYMVDALNNSAAAFIRPFSEFTTTKAVVQIPYSIDTGDYHLKVVSGNNITIKGPLHFTLPDRLTLSSFDFGKTFKKGESVTLVYDADADKYFDHSNATAKISSSGGSFVASVIAESPGIIKITIPDTAPLGTISRIRLYNAEGAYYADFRIPTGQEPITIGE